MKKFCFVCLLSFCVLIEGSFAAQGEATLGRISTVTRLVQNFMGLETTLLDAQLKGDAAGMGALLTDNFEMRIDVMPGEPIPRAEWLNRVLEQRRAGQPEQMAVHDYGDIAIVSFLLKTEGKTKQAKPNAIFIVDIWKRSNENWKLATRYAASASPLSIPGAPLKRQNLDKRY